MVFVKQKGNYENIETGDKIFEPYIIVNSWEKFYFKIHRSSLSKILWELGTPKEKILALIINNINERNNHIYFGKEELIDYFKNSKCKISKKSVEKYFNLLLSHNFIKEVGENELIFNPQLIYSGKKEYYMGDMLEYSCSEFESCKPKRKYKIKEISDFKEITSKTYTGKSRYEIKPNIHFAKIKEDFLDYIYKYSSNKKILVLIQIMHQLFEDPEHIFIERNKFNVDKATLNAVTQYLHKNKIILKTKQLRGVYQINHDYLSSLPIRSYQNY